MGSSNLIHKLIILIGFCLANLLIVDRTKLNELEMIVILLSVITFLLILDHEGS